ncbi:MAG: hypothetical protein QOE70_1719 [Chthoniobacter sp.]|jgi:hypothetical protein|nr:hypothetical protein [Chthoniobacter sp.]
MHPPPLTTPLLLCAILAAPNLWAAEPEPNVKTTAYQTSVAQEQLRGNARRLKEEMLGLLGEFSEYRSAGPELARLKETLEQLDSASQAEMLAVVKTLREASRTENADNARGKILEASGEQKNIQALLRKLADRLILQKDAAAMEQRVKTLALRQVANLRAVKELAASGAKPEKVPQELRNQQAVANSEQEALQNEVKMAMETLRKLAQNPEAAKNEAFKEALAAAEKQGLEEQAKQAAEKSATDFAEAAQAAKALSEGLKNTLQALQKNQSAAEQAQNLAQELKELAQREDRMAKTSARAWGGEREAIRNEQQQISAKLEVAQKAVEKLNAAAGAQTAQAQEKSEQLADSLKRGNKLDKLEAIAKTSDAQRDLAEQLGKASEMLQKQADALAANSPEGSENAPQSAAEAAIGEAVKQVMDAKSQLGLAQRQLRGGDDAGGQQRLGDAQQALQKAQEKAAEAGEAVNQSVGKDLQQAQANTAKGEKGIGQGSKEEQERSRWSLDRARENASAALDGLKLAANQLAAQAAAEAAGKTAGNQPGKERQDGKGGKDGKGPGKAATSRGDQGGSNARGTTGSEATDFSAVARLRSGQREALSLLETEKAPSEYEAMVKQYLRNLAESDSTPP